MSAPLRKTVRYDKDARAWAVCIQHGPLLVQLGGYATPEEASSVGDALVALLCALSASPSCCPAPACRAGRA